MKHWQLWVAAMGATGFIAVSPGRAEAMGNILGPARWIGAAIAVEKETPVPPKPVKIDPESFSDGLDTPRRTDEKGWVSFTFDDGPSLETTPKILAILKAHYVPATFFVVSKRLWKNAKSWKAHRAVLAEAIAAGHGIGNHTFFHRDLSRYGRKAVLREVTRAEVLLTTILGKRPFLFRPPYGRLSKPNRAALRKKKHTVANWNIDSIDYLATNPERLRKKVIGEIQTKNGGILLFHDTKTVTVDALAAILEDLLSVNCQKLSSGENPIVPVSLHYFITNKDGTHRAAPKTIEARTLAYSNWLNKRCAQRARTPNPRITAPLTSPKPKNPRRKRLRRGRARR